MKKSKSGLARIGGLGVGGGNPVRVQSMANTDTLDVRATVAQIKRLEKAGCELVRIAVKNPEAAKKIREIKKRIKIPLVADMHFDWRLAIEALNSGADKIRVNPGNLGGLGNFEKILKACREKGAALRIGVNAGSIKAARNSRAPLKWPPEKWAREMAGEAMEYVRFCEKRNFKNIVVSLKADDIERTVAANRLFASMSRFPQHIGITEAGPFLPGVVKSAIGLAELLKEGIGDTVRVSLTADPVLEVRTAYEILKALKIRKHGPEIISCPTCGRCEVNIEKIVNQLEEKIYSDFHLARKATGLKIAVMGCVVNGPGEAKEADFGIAGGKGSGIFFEKGRQTKILKEKDWIKEIVEKIMTAKKMREAK